MAERLPRQINTLVCRGLTSDPLSGGEPARLCEANALEGQDMTARHRLRNRRAHEVVAFKFRGVSYVVGFSRFSDGALAEVFIDNHKCTSALAADARDAAVRSLRRQDRCGHWVIHAFQK